jgi:hypothetical protein
MNKAGAPRVQVYESPKTDAGRLVAAQVWDRLVAVAKHPVSAEVLAAFLADLAPDEPDDEEDP